MTLSGQVALKGRLAGPTFLTPEQLTEWNNAVKTIPQCNAPNVKRGKGECAQNLIRPLLGKILLMLRVVNDSINLDSCAPEAMDDVVVGDER